MQTGECLALAQPQCTVCFGLGRRQARNGKMPTCNCVWRHIFRICLGRFRSLWEAQGSPTRAMQDPTSGKPQNKPQRRITGEDYLADFVLIAKRALAKRPLGHKIFKFHHLYGAEWTLCCRQLQMDRGSFFHETYRVEQMLGRAFFETLPYGLYPLDEYFAGTVRAANTERSLLPLRKPQAVPTGGPLRAPLAKAA